MSENFTLVHHDGTIYSFDENGLTIGRGRGNTIVLADTSVSRSHARILVRERRSAGCGMKTALAGLVATSGDTGCCAGSDPPWIKIHS